MRVRTKDLSEFVVIPNLAKTEYRRAFMHAGAEEKPLIVKPYRAYLDRYAELLTARQNEQTQELASCRQNLEETGRAVRERDALFQQKKSEVTAAEQTIRQKTRSLEEYNHKKLKNDEVSLGFRLISLILTGPSVRDGVCRDQGG